MPVRAAVGNDLIVGPLEANSWARPGATIREAPGDGFPWWEATTPELASHDYAGSSSLIGMEVLATSPIGQICRGRVSAFRALARLPEEGIYSDNDAKVLEGQTPSAASLVFARAPRFLAASFAKECGAALAVLAAHEEPTFWHYSGGATHLPEVAHSVSVGIELQLDYQRKIQQLGRRAPSHWYDLPLDTTLSSVSTLVAPNAPTLIVMHSVYGEKALRYSVASIWEVGAEQQFHELGSVFDSGLPTDVPVEPVAAVSSASSPPAVLFVSAYGMHVLRPSYTLDAAAEVRFVAQ